MVARVVPDDFPAIDFPQPCGLVRTACDQVRGVGREGAVPYPSLVAGAAERLLAARAGRDKLASAVAAVAAVAAAAASGRAVGAAAGWRRFGGGGGPGMVQ